jgi:hypothetical protein
LREREVQGVEEEGEEDRRGAHPQQQRGVPDEREPLTEFRHGGRAAGANKGSLGSPAEPEDDGAERR